MFAMARPNDDQWQAIYRTVNGRHVHDFGCGVGAFTRVLEQAGALSAVGIDSDEMFMRTASKHLSTAVTKFVCADFADYNEQHPEDFDVGIVSWPVNWFNHGLVQLIQRCKTVIYIGKNTDLTASGGPELFRHLVTRRVIEYLPDFTNTLCVYGEVLEEPRPITGEELAAVRQWGGATEAYTWTEAEAKAAENRDNSVMYARLARVTI